MSAFDPLAVSPLGGLASSLAAAAASGASDEFYTELRDGFAKDIVEQFNTGAVVLIKPSPVQGGDPLNPFGGLPVRTPRNAIVLGFPTDKIDGDRVLASDRRVLIDAADFTTANAPAGDDQVEIDGVLHTLVSMESVPAAGIAVIHMLQCRTAGRG